MKYILFILFFIPLLSFSKELKDDYFTLKFGGWSFHSDNKTKDLYKESTGKKLTYNETHNGIGFDYLKSLSENNKHYIRTGFWYMKDSYDGDSFHLGTGYSYKKELDILDSVMFNIDVVLMHRTNIYSYDYKKQKENKEFYYDRVFFFEREKKVIPIPSITLNITERFNIDFLLMVLPSDYYQVDKITGKRTTERYWEGVSFLRLGYNF